MATDNDCSSILKDVVAYVDVWSSNKTENYSKPFILQLQQMGAQVSKTFNKQVTHVVFKNGHQATWQKAKKTCVRLVSVLWVASCIDDGVHVDEELYPAINDEVGHALKRRAHRCMQPRDLTGKTPEQDKRMRKKLEQLLKDLPPKSPLITDVSPCIIDEENGIVYSPALKRSESMAERLKEMRERRENLSLTASQMADSFSPVRKPSLGSTPTFLQLLGEQSDDDSSTSAAQLEHSSDKKEERMTHDDIDHCHLEALHKKDSGMPWLSPCNDVPTQESRIHFTFPDLDNKEKGTEQNKKSRRSSVKRGPIKKSNSIGPLESPCQDGSAMDSKNSDTKTGPSQIKTCSPALEKNKQSANKSEMGKQKTRSVQSMCPEVFDSRSCLSSPTILRKAIVDQEPSKGISSFAGPQKVNQQITKHGRPSMSALVKSFSLSSVASSSINEHDGVFEDYFSPANHPRPQKTLLPSLALETPVLIPSELDSITRKRRRETIGPETAQKEKRKREEKQSVKNPIHQADSLQREPQKCPHNDLQESPPTMMTRRRSRRHTLLFTSTGEFTTDPVKQQTSIPVQAPTLSLREASAAFHLQKNPMESEQSDDDSSTSAAQLEHSSDKKEERMTHDDIDHCHLEPLHKKDSGMPWLSPCNDVPTQESRIHFTFPDLDNKEKGTEQNKKSRRSSVKRGPIKKSNSIGPLESPCQDGSAMDSKNSDTKTGPSQIKTCSPALEKNKQSANKSEMGKQKTRSVQSMCPEVFDSRSCLSSPTILRKAIVDQEPSKGISSFAGPQKVNQPITKHARPSMSALVKSFSLSSVASSSINEHDGVFEDYFSPANHPRPQKTLLPSLALETPVLIPSELDSITRKRRRETIGPETAHKEKRKREEKQSVKNPIHQADSLQREPQKCPHNDLQESPPTMMTRRRSRRHTLLFTSTGEFTTDPVKQQTSIPVQAPTLSLREASAAFHLQKNPMESRGNECTVAAGLTETISEDTQNQSKQVNLSVKKMDKKTKAMRTLVMTSMPTEKQQIVTQVVRALGGFSIVDRVCDSTTHVVSGGHYRTLNILLGIARGCWVLSFEWILWCLEQRQWIPEEPYELSDHFPAASICRLQQHLSAGEHEQDLFQGQPAMFVSQHSQPPPQSLVELIQLCGGTVCKTVRQAGICIGKYNGRRPDGSRILSEQWVLDCITHLKQLSYDNYDLE